MNLEIERVWVLSSRHVDSNDLEILLQLESNESDFFAREDGYGVSICRIDFSEEMRRFNFSEAFFKVLKFASTIVPPVDRICFDPDARMVRSKRLERLR